MAEFVWRFAADEPVFAGHFPGRPIVPGVLLLDRAIRFAEQCHGAAGLRWQIAQAKFFRPVGPGHTLHYHLVATPAAGWAFSILDDDGVEVASGRLQPVP